MPDSSNRKRLRSRLLALGAGGAAALLLAGAGAGRAQTPPAAPSPLAGQLQIVNVTSVPRIALAVNGTLAYPEFPQRLWTGFFPLEARTARFVATNPANGRKADSGNVTFDPQAHQTLVIMGDFSTDAPPDDLPQTFSPPDSAAKAYPPNVLFKVYSDEMQPGERLLRFRFVNAMPRTPLVIEGEGTALTAVAPGACLVLDGQPRPARYTAVAGTKSYSLSLFQKEPKNQTVVFYLKDGLPAYLTIVESRNEAAQPPPPPSETIP